MDQGDIHLYQAPFFPPPHYTELIIQQGHVSNICSVGCSQTSGKQFSDKWPFLLQVISCLRLLLRQTGLLLFEQGEQILSTFLWSLTANWCACVWSGERGRYVYMYVYSISAHMWVIVNVNSSTKSFSVCSNFSLFPISGGALHVGLIFYYNLGLIFLVLAFLKVFFWDLEIQQHEI